MVESDEEQLEVLKNWWDENGTSLVITVVVTVGAILGYRGWEENVIQKGEAASAVYEDLVIATDNIAASTPDEALRITAVSLAETLKSDHGDTTYAVFAAMRLAKVAVEQNELEILKINGLNNLKILRTLFLTSLIFGFILTIVFHSLSSKLKFA